MKDLARTLFWMFLVTALVLIHEPDNQKSRLDRLIDKYTEDSCKK